jgi:hypothetical protein
MIGLSAMKRKLPVLLIAALAVVGAPGLSMAQESPPAGYVRAQVSTCPPYNPSHCQSKAVFLENRSWCGKRARWWTPTEHNQVVTVACR